MNEDDMPDVVAVLRIPGIALLDDERTVPVTHWFGASGDICPPQLAVSCVAGHDDVGWFAIDLEKFSYVTVH